IALAKPAGMPTIADHGGSRDTLLAQAARLAGLAVDRVHPTSRLDRDVSGVVVFALTRAAAECLRRARETGDYRRRYVAIASDAPRASRGKWDAPIGRGKDARHRKAFGAGAVHARTWYVTIATTDHERTGAALLAIAPQTGRTHQIR